MAIHPAAAQGFESGVDAYERGRPSYPAEALKLLGESLDWSAGQRVLDLGAGTGKLTRLLPSDLNLVAVEPVASMRSKLSALLPRAQVLDGRAEALPVGSESLDSVICAQAFHWFDGPRALREIARVLKPGGKLGLIWNIRDDSVSWVRHLTEIIDAHQGDAPRYREGKWLRAFEATLDFTPLEKTSIRHIQVCTPEMILDRVLSISFIAALSVSIRQEVEHRVRELLKIHPDLREKEQIEFPYLTEVFTCSKA